MIELLQDFAEDMWLGVKWVGSQIPLVVCMMVAGILGQLLVFHFFPGLLDIRCTNW